MHQMRNFLGLVRQMMKNVLHGFYFNFSASSLNIGFFIGCFLGGFLGGKYGPKRTIQCSCIFGALGGVTIATAPHISLLIVGRILCGLGGSFSIANCSLLVTQYRLHKYLKCNKIGGGNKLTVLYQ